MSLCGTNEQLKIELLSQWKLEAEFRNLRRCVKVTFGGVSLGVAQVLVPRDS